MQCNGGYCKSIALHMHIAKLFLVRIICMNCAQWDWTDSSNSWKVVTNLFSLSIERLDELEMLEKVSWKSSNYLVWWRCLPSPLPPTRRKAAHGRHQALGALLSLSKSILFMIALCGRPLHARPSTLCNRLLRTLTLLLETRIFRKFSTHPCYSRHFDWFSWEWSKKM